MRRFIFFVLTVLFTGLSGPIHAESTYDRVIRTGVIRCGYYIEEPLLAKDVNTGQMHGLFYEVSEEMAKRLGLKLDWAEEAPMSNYLEGMRTGRYDMGCGPLYVLGSRARLAHFVSPVVYAPVQMVVRADDHRFDSVRNIAVFNDPALTLAVQEGEAGSVITQQRFPQAKIDSIPPLADYHQLFLEVITGKADSAVVFPASFHDFDKASPGKVRLLPLIVSNAAISYAVPNNDFAFASMVDGAVREILADGTIADIMRRHGYLDSMPVPAPTLQRE